MPSVIADAVVVLYGLWTVACNLTVVSGGNSWQLLATAVMLGLAALVFAGWLLRHARWRRAYLDDLDANVEAGAALDLRGRVVLGAMLLAVLVAWLAGGQGLVVWGGCALFAVLLAGFALRARPGTRSTNNADADASSRGIEPWQHWALHGIALACALFSLVVFRPRTDDAFYVNMALSLVEFPGEPLLAFEHLHGPPTDTLKPQHMFPAYRVHSFEALGGALSMVSGIEVTKVIHLGLATLFSWLVPFALARVLRVLAPRYWLLGVAAAVSFYFIEGSAPRGYSNQALVRMFNGKAALLSVAVPLVCAYGLRFAARPNAWRFALLALAQASMMGMSSTGIWLAPLLGTLAVAAGAPGLLARARTLALGVLASGYVLSLGLWVRGQMGSGRAHAPTAVAQAAQAAAGTLLDADFGLLLWVIPTVLGDASTAATILAMCALAAILAPSALGLRLLAAILLVLTLALANPWLSDLVAGSITGAKTYQRIFWLLPVPLALGLAAVGVFRLARTRLPAVGALASVLAALALFFAVATDTPVLSRDNHAEAFWPPRLKVWPTDRAIAQAACRWGPKGSTILAPLGVSRQLVTLHGCGHPLQAGMRWMSAPLAEERRRNLMQHYVGTQQRPMTVERMQFFVDSLESYGIDVVVVGKKGVRNRDVKAALRRSGWERAEYIHDALIWVPMRERTRKRLAKVAKAVCKRVPRDGLILSSYSVARVLPDGCGRPLMRVDRGRPITEADMELSRLESHFAINQKISKQGEDWLRDQIKQLKPALIVVAHSAHNDRRVRKALKRRNYKSVAAFNNQHIYKRMPKKRKAGAHRASDGGDDDDGDGDGDQPDADAGTDGHHAAD